MATFKSFCQNRATRKSPYPNQQNRAGAPASVGGTDSPAAQPRRRDYPGYLVIRLDGYDMQEAKGPDGNPILCPVKGRDGRPVMEHGKPVMAPQKIAVAILGTTTVSGEKVYMRLNTNAEQMADSRRNVSSMRRSVNAIRMGSGDQAVRGKFGELQHPEDLSVARRPVFRCDNVRAITNAAGDEVDTPDGRRQYRCSWMSVYCNYRDPRSGKDVDMLDHMESTAFSTVDVTFSRSNDKGSPDYYAMFRDGMRKAAEEGIDQFSTACFNVTREIMSTWEARQKEMPGETMGFVGVTSWRPEQSVRIMPGDDAGVAREKLLALFNAERYQPKIRENRKTGLEELVRSSVSPSFALRLLDQKGHVCGLVRMSTYMFDKLVSQANTAAEQADKAGDSASAANFRAVAENLGTPEGRADYLLSALSNIKMDDSVTEKPVGLDILPGDCFYVSQELTHPGHFSANPATIRTKYLQMQVLIQQGMEHVQYPLQEDRQSLGASQLFVSRNPDDIVREVYKTKDMSRFRKVATLAPDGAWLTLSPGFARAVDEEARVMSHLTEAMNKMPSSQVADKNMPEEPAYMQEDVPIEAYEDDLAKRSSAPAEKPEEAPSPGM